MIGPIKGQNGLVSFDGSFVTIERKGFFAWGQFGRSEKRIPLGSIAAVQWKAPRAMTRGFISFTVGGGMERQSRRGRQVTSAWTDENSVVILKSQEPQFLQLREAVEQSIAARQAPQPSVGPAAGWYQAGDGGQQWWDGSRWTGHRQ